MPVNEFMSRKVMYINPSDVEMFLTQVPPIESSLPQTLQTLYPGFVLSLKVTRWNVVKALSKSFCTKKDARHLVQYRTPFPPLIPCHEDRSNP
jgi:hypothetical protein